MLAQLDSDVITPPPKKLKIETEQKQTIIPNEIKPQVSEQNIQEKPKPTVQLPPEPEVDDEEDDLDEIKRQVLDTLSKIEQAEVD